MSIDDPAEFFDADEFAENAFYRFGSAGSPVGILVIRRAPDRLIDFGDTRVRAETTVFITPYPMQETPVKSGNLFVGSELYTLQAPPLRPDNARGLWEFDCRPEIAQLLNAAGDGAGDIFEWTGGAFTLEFSGVFDGAAATIEKNTGSGWAAMGMTTETGQFSETLASGRLRAVVSGAGAGTSITAIFV